MYPYQQGWVPIETDAGRNANWVNGKSSIHPQGWVPIETGTLLLWRGSVLSVAFTPKGGCPLKLRFGTLDNNRLCISSIHPQGWVPIETRTIVSVLNDLQHR